MRFLPFSVPSSDASPAARPAIASTDDYLCAVEEFDRLWATDHAGQARARMDALLSVIEDYERALISRCGRAPSR